MLKFNQEQETIHAQALSLSKKYEKLEWHLIEIFQNVERTKLYKVLDKNSLFAYAVEIVGFSPQTAYAFISVSRKTQEIPQLKNAIKEEKLNVSKASRIVSTLDKSNAKELIQFAATHSYKEIALEIAKLNPKAASPDKNKPLDQDLIEITRTISASTFEKLERAEALEAAQGKSKGDLLDAILDIYLFHKDPVQKAERAMKKKTPQQPTQLCARIVETPKPSRTPLTAKETHTVHARDRGCCTHVGHSGERCNNQRWTEIHHIIPVSYGGSNNPDNLTTLCWFHHDLVHQLSLPIDGQVNWLRSPRRPYLATDMHGSTHLWLQDAGG